MIDFGAVTADPVTGRKTIDPQLIPGTGQPMVVCPHAGGGRSWLPGAYNPDTKILYVPAVETCMNLARMSRKLVRSQTCSQRYDVL